MKNCRRLSLVFNYVLFAALIAGQAHQVFAKSNMAESPTGDLRSSHTSYNVLLWEDFEGSYEIPEGWLAIDHNNDGHNWTISSAQREHDFVQVALSSSMVHEQNPPVPVNPDNWLITPQLNLGEGQYGLSFLRQASDAGAPAENYEVLVSTSGNDTENFVQVAYSETIEQGALWESIFIDLEAFSGEDIYLAFRHHDCYGQGSLMINDVKVYELQPYEFFAEGITPDLHVLAGEEASYHFRVQNRGTENDTYSLELTQGSWYVLSQATLEVAPGETKDFQVSVIVPQGAEMGETDLGTLTITSMGDAGEMETLEMTTTATTPVSADYLEDFNGVDVPELPLGWSKIIESSDPLAGVETSTLHAFSPPNAVSFNNADDPNANLYLVSPKITNAISDLRVSFYAIKPNAWSFPILKAGTISDPTDPDTFNPMETFFFTTEFDQYTLCFENYDGDHQYIAFKYDPANEHYARLYLDNIFIEERKPYDVLVSNLTGDMSVNAGETGVYDIEITNNGMEDDTYTLSLNVEKDWDYSFPESIELNAGQSQVVALSVTVPEGATFGEISEVTLTVGSQNAEEVSAAVEVKTIAINTIADFPFVEEFEHDFIPLGWKKVTTYEGAAWEQSAQHSYSGNFSASASTEMVFKFMDHVADEWLISPRMDLDQDGATSLSFFGKTQSNPDGVIEVLHVYALDVPYQNGDDLREYGELIESIHMGSEWGSHLIDLSHLHGYMYIALNYYLTEEDEASGSNRIFIDDFSIGNFSSFTLTVEIPDGEGVVNPQAGEYSYLEGEEVLLRATPALGWTFSHWEGNVADEYAAETTITMNEDNSVKAFFAEMESEPLPFAEDFSEVDSGSFPENWFRSHSNWNVSDTEHAGGQAPEMVLSPFPMINDNLRLITPPLNLSNMTEAGLSFKNYIEDGPWAGYTLKVQTSVDGSTWEDTGWEHQASKNGQTENPETIEINLDHLIGEEKVFIAWVFSGMTMDLEQWAIDDVLIEGIPEVVYHNVVFEVMDEEGTSVENALITLGDLENEVGDYTFEGIEAGVYDYSVEAEGFEAVFAEGLQVDEDLVVEVTMTVVSQTYLVQFIVEDEEGQALESAVISLGETTNPAGDYLFEDVEAGVYQYIVEKEGFLPFEAEELEVSEDLAITVTLSRDEVNVFDPYMEKINIFPNPATISINIRSGSQMEKVRLFDITGNLVQILEVNGYEALLNVESLPNGVYFLSVKQYGNFVTKRIVITR